jgi:hypothetical protein
MDEEIQKPEPKISDVEIILIGVFYFSLDVMDFIPGVGDVTDVVAAPMGFYYWMKGLNGTAFLASEAIEAIPGAQELPFVRSITWGINIWLDRHPKLQATFATVEALEGGVDALEGGGAAGAAEGISNSENLAAETAENNTAVASSGSERTTAQESAAGEQRPSEESTERDATENKTAGERESEKARGATGASEAESNPEDAEDNEPSEEQRRRAAVDEKYQEFTPEPMQDPIDVVKKRELSDNVIPINQGKSSSEKLNDRSQRQRIEREQQKLEERKTNSAYEDPAA